MTRILFLGVLLSISTVALAGKGNDRNGHDGYYDNSGRQHHNDYDNRHYNNRYERRHYSKHHRHGKRHYVNNRRHARRHSHHGYYRHPRGYVASRVQYRYGGPELVIVYQPSVGFHIDGG